MPSFAGLIIESSFTSIAAMLGTLKWGKLPGASLLVTQPFASVEKLATLTTPMLFLHGTADRVVPHTMSRSEEHTSELQSLMRISYAAFCLKKKNTHNLLNIRHTKKHT